MSLFKNLNWTRQSAPHDSQETKAELAFTFFDLPHELRDLVYGFHLDDTSAEKPTLPGSHETLDQVSSFPSVVLNSVVRLGPSLKEASSRREHEHSSKHTIIHPVSGLFTMNSPLRRVSRQMSQEVDAVFNFRKNSSPNLGCTLDVPINVDHSSCARCCKTTLNPRITVHPVPHAMVQHLELVLWLDKLTGQMCHKPERINYGWCGTAMLEDQRRNAVGGAMRGLNQLLRELMLHFPVVESLTLHVDEIKLLRILAFANNDACYRHTLEKMDKKRHDDQEHQYRCFRELIMQLFPLLAGKVKKLRLVSSEADLEEIVPETLPSHWLYFGF